MSETAKRTLVKKLAEIMGEVERVAKDGRNDFHNYDYATEAAIAAAVRAPMAARSIIMIPYVETCEVVDIPTRSGTQKLCTLKVKFTIEDGESGETREMVVVGQGTDAGDKASYKAMTGAEKYALLKLFLIPTGTDPELEDEEEKPVKAAAPRPRPPFQPKQRELSEGERIEMEGERTEEVTPEGDFGPIIPFGKNKGKHASQLTAKSLDWYIEAANKELADPSKAKYHAKTKAYLQGLIGVRATMGKAYSPFDPEDRMHD